MVRDWPRRDVTWTVSLSPIVTLSDPRVLWMWWGSVAAQRVFHRLRPRQAERALGDDVALDLVGAAVDRVGAAEEEQPLQVVELAASPATSRAGAATSTASSPSRGATRPVQLGDRRLRPGRPIRPACAARCSRMISQLRSTRRRAGRAAPGRRPRRSPGDRDDRVELAPRTRSAGPAWTTPRSKPSVPIATRQPSPGAPTTLLGRGPRRRRRTPR